MAFIGVPIGILIGVISGAIFIIIVKTAFRASGLKGMSVLIAELTALATFCLGGGWAATGILKDVDESEILSSYLPAFAITFLIVVALPLFRFVIAAASRIGESGGPADD